MGCSRILISFKGKIAIIVIVAIIAKQRYDRGVSCRINSTIFYRFQRIIAKGNLELGSNCYSYGCYYYYCCSVVDFRMLLLHLVTPDLHLH